MPIIKRTILTVGAAWLVYLFVYWIVFAFYPAFSLATEKIVALACGACAGGMVWFATHADAQRNLTLMFVNAVVGGGIAFALGFFGPMIFAPGANQGPLLGFVTGPVGFLVGAVVGFVRTMTRRDPPATLRRADPQG